MGAVNDTMDMMGKGSTMLGMWVVGHKAYKIYPSIPGGMPVHVAFGASVAATIGIAAKYLLFASSDH